MELEEIRKQAEGILAFIRGKEGECKKEIEDLDKLKGGLRGKIEQIQDFYVTGEKRGADIFRLLENAQKLVEEAEKARSSIIQLNSDVASYQEQFSGLRVKLDSPENGLNSTLEWSQQQREDINKKYEEIIELKVKSEAIKAEIEEYGAQVIKAKEESEDLKASIAKTLDLVTATSLTDAFDKRRRVIAQSTSWWFWLLVISVVGLGGAFLYIYTTLKNTESLDLVYRYLIASPFIYLVYIAAKNYKIERDYEERYAFKAVLATSLESYIKLLSDKFSEQKDGLFEFTLKIMRVIYEKPYMRTDSKTRYNFSLWNMFKGEFEQNEESKEVKDGPETKNKDIAE